LAGETIAPFALAGAFESNGFLGLTTDLALAGAAFTGKPLPFAFGASVALRGFPLGVFAVVVTLPDLLGGFDFEGVFTGAFPPEGTRLTDCFGRSFAASRLAGLGLTLLTFFVVFADMDVTRTQPLRA
jgi:hypothetical protein